MANLQSLFQEFNLSKFIVYTCLLMFTVLFAMRLDGTITISYWAVFLPLWIWKSLVLIGASIGICVWSHNPDYRLSESSYISFKSMLISLSLQLLLLMFELLVCDKLESGRHLWTLVFIPLLFVSLLSVAITVWSLKHDRAFELELFCAVNVLQFLFIALRLDHLLTWSWVVVFVPFWVLITLAVIGVLYALIFAAILLRTPEIAVDQRRASFNSAISYSLIVMPLVVFLILLANKLDHQNGSIGLHQQSLIVSHTFPYASTHHHPSPSPSAPPSAGQISSGASSGNVATIRWPSLQQPSPSSSSSLSSSSPSLTGSIPFSSSAGIVPHAPGHQSPGAVAAGQISYFTVCCPLYLAFMILICLSFGSRGGNLWWFGMRRDFCSFLLTICPCLQEYGNISYYSKHTSNQHELDRDPVAVVANSNADNSSSGSSNHSSSNGLTGLSAGSVVADEADSSSSGRRVANLEKSLYNMRNKMSTMIVCQPTSSKLSSHLHHHVTIESPD